MDAEVPALVIDCGESTTKVGFAGDDAPKSFFPSIVGYSRTCGALEGGIDPYKIQYWVGNDAQSKREILWIRRAIEDGRVTNFDNLHHIVHHMYKYLQISRDECPVLWAADPFSPDRQLQDLVQMFFETFDVPAFYLTPHGSLAVYGAGRSSALSLDFGEDAVNMIYVNEGKMDPNEVTCMRAGGGHCTRYLASLLGTTAASLHTSEVQAIKEKMCYVSSECFDVQRALFNAESSSLDKKYTLPNGDVITLRHEQISACEIFFQPALVNITSPNLPTMVANTLRRYTAQDISGHSPLTCLPEAGDTHIHQLPNEIRRHVAKFAAPFRVSNGMGTIVCSGGPSMVPGLQDRLSKELRALLPRVHNISCLFPEERKHLVWIGGSILASLSTFQQQWISKQGTGQQLWATPLTSPQQIDYDEHGPPVYLHKT